MIGILTLQERNKSINPFSFKQLVKSFNLALIVQFILAVILFTLWVTLIIKYMQKETELI